MTNSVAAMVLVTLAGVAPSAVAGGPFNKGDLVPTRKAGVMYINMGTGERTLTRYDAEVVPEIDAARNSASLFDYWMSIDENPCWDDPREDGFGLISDATDDPSWGVTEPVVTFDFGDMPFDSKIAGVLLSIATLALEDDDSNGDGVLDTSIDAVAVYYDALSEANSTSIAPPTAAIRIESIPGVTGDAPNGVSVYDLIVDFGDDWFELGDSDGQELGLMNLPGANAGQDIEGTFHREGLDIVNTLDGLADFQYLQYYAQHGSNDKVTEDSTFINFGMPEGDLTVITYTSSLCTCSTSPCNCVTTTITIFEPDPFPQGQGVFESIGFGVLGPGGDTTNLEWTLGTYDYGCCFWFGGLDCAGFLDQLVEDPPYNHTWYAFNPYAQLSHGFFSDAPSGSACDAVDFNNDGFIDSGDINEFITLFLSGSSPADLNNDGFIDSGDITAFVELFLGCAE